jgi:outer membrane biogenesis lipoprotein LolB
MPPLNALSRAVGALVAMLLIAACSSPSSMTPQQKEAYELRRYCEQNTGDVAKCLGYLGDH